jgi:hypothetical protein
MAHDHWKASSVQENYSFGKKADLSSMNFTYEASVGRPGVLPPFVSQGFTTRYAAVMNSSGLGETPRRDWRA